MVTSADRDEVFAAQLKALADPTRFKIAQLLLERRHCSRSIAMTLGISEPAVSQHMSLMRSCGLVSAYRHGHHMHYVLEEQPLRDIAARFGALADATTKAGDCHTLTPCQFMRKDGTSGCALERACCKQD